MSQTMLLQWQFGLGRKTIQLLLGRDSFQVISSLLMIAKFLWYVCSCCLFFWFVFAVDGVSESVPTVALLIPSNCCFEVQAALPRGCRIVGKHSCCCFFLVCLAALCAPFARGVSSDVWWSVGKEMRTLATKLDICNLVAQSCQFKNFLNLTTCR